MDARNPVVTRRKRRALAACALAAALLALAVWALADNETIVVARYAVVSDELPAAFDGFTIAQISDLHNAEFGEGSSRLLAELQALSPDLIAVTGDLIDARRTDVGAAMAFVRGAVEIAPVYYVAGNHEARSDAFASLEAQLAAAGARVLRNAAETVSRGGAAICVAGLDDPAFAPDADFAALAAETVSGAGGGETFVLLLAHRPERFDAYCAAGADLVLAGHAHGGQVRLPLLGGLYAPGQGFLPEYDAGQFVRGGTTMIVSRGLGNSAFPLRVNNPPELVAVELRSPSAGAASPDGAGGQTSAPRRKESTKSQLTMRGRYGILIV